MNNKISNLISPALAGVVKERGMYDAMAEIKNAMYSGATMIDLHLSCLENTDVESLKRIVNSTRLPILALNYNNTVDPQNGASFSEEERIASFLRAAEAGVAGVDMQGYTYHLPSKTGFCGENKYSFTKANPKEVVTDEVIIAKQCEFIERVHALGSEVLMSCHPCVFLNCEQVVDLALFMEKRNPDVIKIVTVASNGDELAETIKTMLVLKREVKTPVTYHSSGRAGILSRIINPILGGHIAFCVDRYQASSALEQIDLRTARSIVDNVKRITEDHLQ